MANKQTRQPGSNFSGARGSHRTSRADVSDETASRREYRLSRQCNKVRHEVGSRAMGWQAPLQRAITGLYQWTAP